ncbi:MAG: acyl-CoA desaturase [Archangium sp.]|nr:acyl-CoA desaturase [Archangium sp.]
MTNRPTFNTDDTSFKVDLRTRVDAYFTRTGKSRHADGRMIAKTIAFFGAGLGLMTLLISGVLPALAALPVVMVLGLVIAGLGFNVGHDAVHGAYSGNRSVNKVLGFVFDVLGASSYNWSRAHNIVHHTFTNVPGTDHDLEPGPFLLLHPRPKPPLIYRLQHLFAFPLYAFTMIVWVFKKDFVQIFDRTMTGRAATKGGVASMVLGKLLHFSIFLGLPMLLAPYAWWVVLVGYAVMLASVGFTLAVVFQLAHVVEGPQFPAPDAAGRLADGWATHQLRTTANFSQGSALASFFLGGLNNQIEHHLLPGICHIHYAALAPLVRECASDHGLPYLTSGTFFEALASHIRTLYRLGRPIRAPAQRLGALTPLVAA